MAKGTVTGRRDSKKHWGTAIGGGAAVVLLSGVGNL